VTTDQVLAGVGLILVLAVGSQVLASRLHIPAQIILLPVGFLAGAVTSDVNPERLLGPSFEPLVSLSVAVILYDAGLDLDLRKLRGHTRRIVTRLIVVGVPVTWIIAATCAALLVGMSGRAALMTGAILVVSGPTVVGPLLNAIRPAERLQRVLTWEGSLIDPIGGILGAVVFGAVTTSTRRAPAYQFVQFLLGIGIGTAGGIAGTAILWFLLRRLQLGEVLGTTSQLATVVGVAAACDIIRDDAGLVAAIIMGLAVANIRRFDIPARRPFFATLVQLIIGVMFIAISATVTPQSLHHLILPVLGLVTVLVLVARPLVATLATLRTDMPAAERRFTGWMAPRGIGGASKILPVTFLVIVGTVTLYGLTAGPVARRLGVTRPARTRPLLVGGQAWVIDLACGLKSAGLDVLLWAGFDEERDRIRQADLELAPGELLAAATGRGAQLQNINAVLLLTNEDDFNALACTVLEGSIDGPVYRLGPRLPSHGVVAPFSGGQVLFGTRLTRYDIGQRYAAGEQIVNRPADGAIPSGMDLLFLVRADGRLDPATASNTPTPHEGDTVVLLGSAPVSS